MYSLASKQEAQELQQYEVVVHLVPLFEHLLQSLTTFPAASRFDRGPPLVHPFQRRMVFLQRSDAVPSDTASTSALSATIATNLEGNWLAL